MNGNKPTEIEVIPDIFLDPDTTKSYNRGKVLGKGGLAKWYELTDSDSGKVYAGKIVSKKVLLDPHKKEMIDNEISVNRLLVHNHIVGFHTCLENKDFVVIVLELCNRRSLMELVKRRKTVTEFEARYFMHHLLLGVKHLHENKIEHRDLKLSNLFLNDNMELKIGDFRLAAKLEFNCEKKESVCGMSKNTEPEILFQKDHSYEVDIWSMGCILYTLLVGQFPFENSSLEISDCIKGNNEVHFPSHVGPLARTFIISMLQAYPTSTRPTVDQCLNDDYMTKGYMPLRLPLSCLTMSPRFDPCLNNNHIVIGQPFAELNEMQVVQGSLINLSSSADTPFPAASSDPSPQLLLRDLQEQLTKLISLKPNEKVTFLMDEAENPIDVPMVYVSSYDYSDKFGFGYRMTDDTIGVYFNDFSNLSLHVDGKTVMYVEKDGIEQYDHTLQCYPAILWRKMKLLAYYRSYWQKDLIKAERSDSSIPLAEIDKFFRLPFLRQWFRTCRSVVMHLSNGTFQVDYFRDNVQLILCPLMGAVSVIDKDPRTYRLTSLAQYGCSNGLFQRLEDVRDKIDCFLEPNTNDLLLAIQSRQNVTVNEKLCDTSSADLKAEGVFNWNGLYFERATPIFAAVISDQILLIRLLVTKIPHFQFQSIISNGNLETEAFQLDVLELVGASCIVLGGDESVLCHGFDCWRKALEIRYRENSLVHPKEHIEQSHLEQIALRHTQEFESRKDLNLLVHQRRKENRTLQAFLVSRRILMKYGLFPNRFFVSQIHQATFLTWDYHQLNRSYLFCYCLYLMEIFPPVWLRRQESSDIPWSVIDSMLDDFRRIVFDRIWCHNQQFKEEPVLSVDHLIMALDFVCAYFVCLHEKLLWSYPQPEQLDKLERIIIQMLVLLDLTELSSEDNKRVCDLLREYFAVFYDVGMNPNLLIIACSSLTNNSAFNVIEMLLKTGLNPFLTDFNGRSPLHLLATAEFSMAPWEGAHYPSRAELFTRCVNAFLNSKCKYDFIDREGKSGLDVFKETYHLYPDEKFRSLLRDFFYLSVRPLSCLSAQTIQKHNSLVTEVPDHLQFFVKRH